jgi:Domain of unknown function (DUF1906).
MTIEGVDYSFARPDPRKLAAADKRFAGRYVGVGSPGKRLTMAEARSLAGAGLSIVSLVEEAKMSPMNGYREGMTHAAAALMEATRCGMPRGYPYYFAVDWDATLAEMFTVGKYFEGVAQVLYPAEIGVYAGIKQLDWLLRRGLARWGFQTYAWSDGRWDPRAQIQQYDNHVIIAGAEVDLCRAVVGDYGQWLPGQPDRPTGGGIVGVAEEVWNADIVPVAGNEANPTWRAKLVVGYTLDLVKILYANSDAYMAKLVEIQESLRHIGEGDQAAIVADVAARVRDLIGPMPTAEAIAREIIRQMREDPVT